MARQLSLPGMRRSPRDMLTERWVETLPEAVRPVYLEALHRASQLRAWVRTEAADPAGASAADWRATTVAAGRPGARQRRHAARRAGGR